MSNLSILDPNNTTINSNLNSLFASATAEEKTYSEDAVTISDEAIELLEELRFKENQTYVLTENQKAFDRVSKALPATDGFDDMLTWLSEQTGEDSLSIGNGVEDEYNRNVYEKDPDKYADLWSNMYNHFSDLMESLGLANDETMKREVLSNEDVSLELMTRFKSSFSDETNELLTYFNIEV